MTKPRERTSYTLGRLGKSVGLARSSVLHYESLGLLAPRARSAAGYRLYDADDLQRLRTIRSLRDAGLSLADIRELLASRAAAPDARPRARPRPAEVLERRLLALCAEMERARRQQRLLARLLALPEFRGERLRCDKAGWVALLHRAGLDDAAMRQWHVEFERDSPAEHETFLRSLGLAQDEVDEVRQRSRAA
jgi:DNA-binding transcriptional MerR regulator